MKANSPRGKVIKVDRGEKKFRAGQGLLKGMAVIWSHWGKSWTQRLTNFDQIAGTFTVEYPEERIKLAEAYRNVPILLYDDKTGHELCTSCFQCERICPPQVIHMVQAKHPETDKPIPAVSEFIIEYDACMGCGLCHEICPFDAIKMDSAYELSTEDHPALTVRKRDLLRPISYYESIAPNLWKEVKDGAMKKLEGGRKRRVGTIGVAPQAIESGKFEPAPAAEPATAKAKPAPAARDKPAPAAEPAAAPEAKPEAKDDKAAKLAEIRARNAAKKQQEEGETPPPAETGEASTTPPADTAPQDEKARRLAEIRARNAAKKQQEEGETPPPAETGEASTTPPADTAPQDEKARRLAEIRARNAAKKQQESGETGTSEPGNE
jgi:NADH-quinone oxidoreductase subunit I/electron transport complex protein RnfC